MLVSTATLAAHLGDPQWVVFDCRHDLLEHARGPAAYAAGHVPGAHFAAVETALAGAKNGRNGRHPLPDPATFISFLAAHGVSPDTHVVPYDDAGGLYAARLWWLARWVGVRTVSLLDGGINRWSAEKRPLETQVPTPHPVNPWHHQPAEAAVSTAEAVQRRLDDPRWLVIDARAPARFRGESEPIDPVAGHIPGAVNRFYQQNLLPDLTFRPAAELRAEFLALLGGRAPTHVAHQCGSGITACANLFAMDYAGLPGSALYAGSWSEWVADPRRPVARG